MKFQKALRGKDALDPEVLLWQSDRVLEQAYAALDRVFRKLGYDEEDVWSFCRPTGSTISSSDCKSGRKNRKTLTTKTENKQRRIFTQPSIPFTCNLMLSR